jgi:hypothetical protein
MLRVLRSDEKVGIDEAALGGGAIEPQLYWGDEPGSRQPSGMHDRFYIG